MSSTIVHPVILALIIFGSMILEARRAANNERTQRARGGLEPAGDVYGLMQFAYPGIFAAMGAESVILDRPPVFFSLGLALFALSKALKWWAITTLGASWTFRVIVVPGSSVVRSGPYRWLRHPNYVAVVGEIVSVALMSGARIMGPLALLLFGALMLRRIAVENRALDAILRRG